jgi:hypothetical protein
MTRVSSSPTPIKAEEFLAILRGERPPPENEGTPAGVDQLTPYLRAVDVLFCRAVDGL